MAGSKPKGLRRFSNGRFKPQQIYEDSARNASAKVKDYYERLTAPNGLKLTD